MTIRSSNFPALMHLLSADLSCRHIASSSDRLKAAASHWKAINQGVDDGLSYPPIDIAADCTLLLTSAAAVSRSLFLGDRKGKRAHKAATRSTALITLLGNPQLSTLQSLAVRNSWEHIDERLDDLLSERVYTSYSEIHVQVQAPKVGTFALRIFDPVNLEIGYGPDRISMVTLCTEAIEVRSRVEQAIQTLNTREVLLYD